MSSSPQNEETHEARASWRPGTLEHESPIDVWRLTRRFLIAVAAAATVFAVVLWGPWY